VPSDDALADLIAKRHMADQDVAFYTQKLKGIVSAYRGQLSAYDRETLLANMSKAFLTTGNTETDLSNMLVIAVDILARRT
jgi:hypothetical protein